MYVTSFSVFHTKATVKHLFIFTTTTTTNKTLFNSCVKLLFGRSWELPRKSEIPQAKLKIPYPIKNGEWTQACQRSRSYHPLFRSVAYMYFFPFLLRFFKSRTFHCKNPSRMSAQLLNINCSNLYLFIYFLDISGIKRLNSSDGRAEDCHQSPPIPIPSQGCGCGLQ